MPLPATIWKQKNPPQGITYQQLSEKLGVNYLYSVLLANRGITDLSAAKDFLNLSENQFHDPLLMKGMQTAVHRIITAVTSGHRIMVYGDYDVDGTTGVSLMFSFLRHATENIEYYIPDRYTEGYGISKKGIDTALAHGCQLIIAVDCGIRSTLLVDYAAENQIDFIICDHHIPGNEIPRATAVLDPKQPDCYYPFKELSGCGIALKLCQALETHSNLWPNHTSMEYIDLAAVSTCCDIVSMTGENRLIVHLGLQKLNNHPSLGLQVLMSGANKDKDHLYTVSDVVFRIGPRINAAGRIASALSAVELLLCKDSNEAMQYSHLLNDLNAQRSDLDVNITEEALALTKQLPNFETRFTTVVYNPHWHKGVVGIVASRIMEKYYRPTLVLTKSDDLIAGSARSIDKLDVHNALTACEHLLEQFGGHSHAAGVKLKPENLEVFIETFENIVASQLVADDLIPVYQYECELDLDHIGDKVLENINRFSPFGPDNMEPVFLAKQVTDTGLARTIGKNHEHLKMNLKSNNGTQILGAIAFKHGEHFERITTGKPFDILYTISMNHFNGTKKLQLEIKDIHFQE